MNRSRCTPRLRCVPSPAPGWRWPPASSPCWRRSSSPPASRAPAPPRQRATPLLPAGQKPNFVVIQTDDQTIDQLYATYTPPGGAPIPAMPNTLAAIAGKGISFNRYYVPYPLCCPSRVSLLTGRYAHNHNVRGNVPPNGGYTGFSFRQANSHNVATWLQAAGYRTIHVGKFLNGYGDEPYRRRQNRAARLERLALGDQGRHRPLLLRLHAQQQRHPRRPDRRLRQLGHARIRRARRLRLPVRAAQRPALPLRDRRLHPHRQRRDVRHARRTALLPAARLHRPARRLPPPGRPRAGDPPLRLLRRRALPARPLGRLQRGQRQRQAAASSAKPPTSRRPRPTPTASTTRRAWSRCARSTTASSRSINTLGAMGRLRNTYILFTSDNGFFYGEHRLTGGKFLAYEPATHVPLLIRGPGIKPGSATGELAANIDIAPTILELAGADADKSIDGRSLVPYMRRPRAAHPAARSSSSPSSRPTTSKPRAASPWRRRPEPRGTQPRPRRRSRRLDRRPAQGLQRDPPRPLQVHRMAERRKRALRHQQRPVRAQQQSPRQEPLPDPQLPHDELRRLAACVGKKCQTVPENPADPAKAAGDQTQKEKEQREREKRQKEREAKQKGSSRNG